MTAEQQPSGAKVSSVSATSTEPSVSDLIGRLTSDVSTLFREELELAKVELRQEAQKAGKAAGKLGAAAVVGFIAALLLSWALAWLIALALGAWAGFAIVGVIYAIVAAVLGLNGKKQLQAVNPTPEQTVDTLQDDKEWVKNR